MLNFTATFPMGDQPSALYTAIMPSGEMSEVKYTVDFPSVISCTVEELLEDELDELPVLSVDELSADELEELLMLSADELSELSDELSMVSVVELSDDDEAFETLDELSDEISSSGGKTKGASLPVSEKLHPESPKATITLNMQIDNFFI